MRPRAAGLVAERERCGKTATGVNGDEDVHGDKGEGVDMKEGVSVSVMTCETEPTVEGLRERERREGMVVHSSEMSTGIKNVWKQMNEETPEG